MPCGQNSFTNVALELYEFCRTQVIRSSNIDDWNVMDTWADDRWFLDNKLHAHRLSSAFGLSHESASRQFKHFHSRKGIPPSGDEPIPFHWILSLDIIIMILSQVKTRRVKYLTLACKRTFVDIAASLQSFQHSHPAFVVPSMTGYTDMYGKTKLFGKYTRDFSMG